MKKLVLIFSVCLIAVVAVFITLSCSNGTTDPGSTKPELITENRVFTSPPIDVLFVMDNSGNMNPYVAKVLDNAGTVLSVLATKSCDFRCAVTSTEAYKNTALTTEYSKKSGETLITRQSAGYLAKFKTNLDMGINGSGTERALESMRSALSSSYNAPNNFPAPGSFLAVIFIGNEDEAPPANAVSEYVQYLSNLTGDSVTQKKSVGYSLSVANEQTKLEGETVSNRISELCAALGGFTYDIHESDFAPFFAECANKTLSLATPLTLGSTPDATTLRVSVNGMEAVRSQSDGWEYNQTTNSVSFHGNGVPAIGSTISITYMEAE